MEQQNDERQLVKMSKMDTVTSHEL